MPKIDNDKYHQKRYFACLGMLMLDLYELSENFMIRGYSVRRILDKYSTSIYADKKRVRVGLNLPPELTSEKVVNEFQREIFKNFKKYERVKNHIKAGKNAKV